MRLDEIKAEIIKKCKEMDDGKTTRFCGIAFISFNTE